MARGMRTTAVVQPGSSVQIVSPELRVGETVEVIALEDDRRHRRSICEILAGCEGGRLFRTADEVDAYIKTERESWDR